jgi:Tfp pilus assembly protein PilV
VNHRLSKIQCVPLLARKQCVSRKVQRHCLVSGFGNWGISEPLIPNPQSLITWRSSGTPILRRSSGTPLVRRADRRQGAVLVLVIVCVVVALVLLLSIAKLAAAGRRMTDQQSWQLQATWLAESGLERAAWRLAADADYTGETWTLSADQLADDDSAVVAIQVEPLPEQPNRRLVRVQADYPDHPQHRARQSTQAVVQLAP